MNENNIQYRLESPDTDENENEKKHQCIVDVPTISKQHSGSFKKKRDDKKPVQGSTSIERGNPQRSHVQKSSYQLIEEQELRQANKHVVMTRQYNKDEKRGMTSEQNWYDFDRTQSSIDPARRYVFDRRITAKDVQYLMKHELPTGVVDKKKYWSYRNKDRENWTTKFED